MYLLSLRDVEITMHYEWRASDALQAGQVPSLVGVVLGKTCRYIQDEKTFVRSGFASIIPPNKKEGKSGTVLRAPRPAIILPRV
jgi:hypothetical protein